MSVLPYTIMIGAVLLALITAIVGGGVYWIVPAIIWPIIFVYFLFDRRLKARENDEEDELVHSAEGGASGAQ
ncbi:MAG: hypothetical protein AVDCRST_MAG30-3140 [uncultured Solirubrobacteraceae bacterium]|uniref:Uncharacterized protein n=1 Tax=uncultured Solirubrobacteraceae bacterium TaxID=1162706 RepID=A0A6J4THH5_9ACTN|nr:MAG: hypothetical protein AVDCRST_MAG30-3140 [uncultured Solirubrobacteraceae bacterium]